MPCRCDALLIVLLRKQAEVVCGGGGSEGGCVRVCVCVRERVCERVSKWVTEGCEWITIESVTRTNKDEVWKCS